MHKLTAELLQTVSLLLDLLSSPSHQCLHLVRQQSVKLQFQRVDLHKLQSTNLKVITIYLLRGRINVPYRLLVLDKIS